jgi:hypothetical protein
LNAGAGQQRKVLSFQRREKVAMDHAKAPTILGIEINIANAVTHRGTNVVLNLMP